MTEMALPQGRAKNWSNGFLPAYYQGTALRPKGSPLLDLEPQPFKTRAHQRAALDQLSFPNDQHAKNHPEHADLAARMESYELAYRMQMEVPDIVDLDGESEKTREMYGMDDKVTHDFGRQCLMARRLVEKGTRFVQIFAGGWDSHDYLERGGVYSIGRGHNADAMTIMMAGGGVKKGAIVGATDDIGAQTIDVARPIRDFHCTLLGLDDNKLTYFHSGRYKQLSQFGGTLIKELIG